MKCLSVSLFTESLNSSHLWKHDYWMCSDWLVVSRTTDALTLNRFSFYTKCLTRVTSSTHFLRILMARAEVRQILRQNVFFSRATQVCAFDATLCVRHKFFSLTQLYAFDATLFVLSKSTSWSETLATVV